MTFEELSVAVAALPEPLGGYRRLTSVTGSGYGSFSMVAPEGWVDWFLTQDPSPIVEVAASQDSAWSLGFAASLERDNEVAGEGQAVGRVAIADPESASLQVVSVTLSPAGDLDASQLKDVVVEALSATGAVERVDAYRIEGGGWLEVVVGFDNPLTGWVEPVVEQKMFLLDETNGWLWSVTCNLHESIADDEAERCTMIQRSFVPFGPVVEE